MGDEPLHRLAVVDVAGRDGVARLEGRVVFIPFTLPGDTVLVRLVRETKAYAHGRAVKLLEGGEGRVEPACPHFGICGGCDWLHIAHPLQLRLKGRLVAGLARKNARLTIDTPPVEPAEPFGYRPVARLQVARVRGELRLGYYVRESHELVAWERCPLLAEPLNAAVEALRGFLRRETGGDWSRLCELIVERAAGGWGLTLVFDGDAPSDLDWPALAAGLPGLVALRVRGGDKGFKPLAFKSGNISSAVWGAERFDNASAAIPLLKTPGVFRQPNDAGARWLHNRLAELCAGLKPQTAWDLYGGGGLLGSAALAAGARLWLVEADPLAAADAEVNLPQFGDEYAVTAGTVERALADGPPDGFDRPGLVILDPPRTGLPKGVVEALVALVPPLVAYVSCNPARFWRDAALFIKGGYRLEKLDVFDMLPQTPGVEILGLLRRTDLSPGLARRHPAS